jgi:hypothetical protein
MFFQSPFEQTQVVATQRSHLEHIHSDTNFAQPTTPAPREFLLQLIAFTHLNLL